MKSMLAALTPYLEQLQTLPFVQSVSVAKEQVQVNGVKVDALLSIKTPTGQEKIYCELRTSNMSHELAAQVVTMAPKARPMIVAAPTIGAGVGDFLAENGTSYVDLRGNCYVDLGGRYIAKIQGKTGETIKPARALRTPSYQVLFTVLAEPLLIAAPVRTLALAAGVSRQPVVTLRDRLLELRLILKGAHGYVWAPQGQKRALELWLAGYSTSVRQGMLIGTYRTQDVDPGALEARISPILDKTCGWKWGGGAASHRLTGYFRGEKTVVHVTDEPTDLPRQLRAIPAQDGPLVLLRSPGPKGLVGTTADTAHPLLVYTELLTDGLERAHDAAEELKRRFLVGEGS